MRKTLSSADARGLNDGKITPRVRFQFARRNEVKERRRSSGYSDTFTKTLNMEINFDCQMFPLCNRSHYHRILYFIYKVRRRFPRELGTSALRADNDDFVILWSGRPISELA